MLGRSEESLSCQQNEAQHANAILLPGGVFTMGSDRHYREEAPRHLQSVDAFWLSKSPVSNEEFAAFVDATGYKTEAEIPRQGQPAGSAVFRQPETLDRLGNAAGWWEFREGASWRKPDAVHTLSAMHDTHPVVQVSIADALAFAAWAEAALPMEAEWEYAASLGQGDRAFPWGDDLVPPGGLQANIWAEGFPLVRHPGLSPWGTSPIGRYPANAAGAFDMIGNVWEWTLDFYQANHSTSACCGLSQGDDVRVLKGGSHLCSPSYCQRYRPTARHPQAADSPTSHIGFRVIWRGTGDGT